jgi:N-dimethylarginine dimethylaminohydrolase
VSAPRPRLADEIYNASDGGLALRDHEPVFDAANVLRAGRDLLYLISDSGNRCGAHWLQTMVGSDYRVRAYDNVYHGTHIDTTITLVRPGLVVVNAERVGPRNLPDMFRDWEVIYLSEVADIGFTNTAYASVWIGLNFMMVNPDTAIVDRRQTALLRELEKRRVTVIPLQLRHARTLGGGFHCVTLDVRRRGTLETYCPPPLHSTW